MFFFYSGKVCIFTAVIYYSDFYKYLLFTVFLCLFCCCFFQCNADKPDTMNLQRYKTCPVYLWSVIAAGISVQTSHGNICFVLIKLSAAVTLAPRPSPAKHFTFAPFLTFKTLWKWKWIPIKARRNTRRPPRSLLVTTQFKHFPPNEMPWKLTFLFGERR